MDNSALFKIGYGLYVVTTNSDGKDNGCIINTVLQVSSTSPATGVIAVNKQNLTHDMITKSKKFNISVLTQNAPFDIFKHFGFQSGKNVDKFTDATGFERSKNGIIYLPYYTNAFISFDVTDTIDFDTHTMFCGKIVDAKVLSSEETLTYSYYQANIKPKPVKADKAGYRCNICGYVHEGESLPADFVCPLCKHGAIDFSKI